MTGATYVAQAGNHMKSELQKKGKALRQGRKARLRRPRTGDCPALRGFERNEILLERLLTELEQLQHGPDGPADADGEWCRKAKRAA